jgi:hypothetical protein
LSREKGRDPINLKGVMRLIQKVFLWIYFISWTLTLAIWYFFDQYSWGFTNFVQASIFWGVLAWLTHISFKRKEKMRK